MRLFKKFLEVANKGLIVLPDEERVSFIDSLNAFAKQAKIFVVHPSLAQSLPVSGPMDTDAPAALPFEVCWFEFNEHEGRNYGMKYNAIDVLKDAGRAVGWLLAEVGPDKYMVYMLMQHDDTGQYSISDIKEVSANTPDGISIRTFEKIFDSDVRYGSKSNNENIKFRNSRGEKEFYKIKKIVHVWPKKMSQSKEGQTINVVWSHRFWSRGHWRDIPGGLGKDRNGNYCVPHKTWVIESIKGPPHLPLISDKVRVVRPDKTV